MEQISRANSIKIPTQIFQLEGGKDCSTTHTLSAEYAIRNRAVRIEKAGPFTKPRKGGGNSPPA